MQIFKWEKIRSEPEYIGPRIKVRKDFFKLPDGEVMDFSVLERGKIVSVLPITKENEIVVVKQYRPAVDDITIDIPGGGIYTRKGEKPIDAAHRELKEETGYESNNLYELDILYPDSGRSEQIRYIFVAEELVAGKQKLEKTEFIKTLKIPYQKVLKMIQTGEIKETTLVLAVLLHRLRKSSLKKKS